MSTNGTIRCGIGGWVYPPWRGTFYPKQLKQAEELAYASRRLSAIEINGTFYRLQTPQTYRHWRDQTPDGFVFSLKGPRFITHRRDFSEIGPFLDRFVASGPRELGPRLGPILWQFAATLRFDAAVFAGNRNPVKDVMVGGAWQVRDGRHRRREAVSQRFLKTMQGLA